MNLKNIKSWHILTTGVFIQLIFDVYRFINYSFELSIFIPALVGLVLLGLLYYPKTQSTGAALNAILSIGLLTFVSLTEGYRLAIVLATFLYPVMTFLLISSCYYFWKKV